MIDFIIISIILITLIIPYIFSFRRQSNHNRKLTILNIKLAIIIHQQQVYSPSMDELIKQTYMYLSLEAAIEQLKLSHCSSQLHQLMKPIIQQELQKVMRPTQNQSSSKNNVSIDAKLVLDSQFPVGETEDHKFQAVLYDISINL